MAALIEEASVQPHPDGWLRRIRRYVVAGYEAVLARANRFGGLITLFALQLVVNAGMVALIVAGDLAAGVVAEASGQKGGAIGILPISDWLLIVSTLIPAILVVIAVYALRQSRMTALRLFHRGVLLSILFTEVFMFYRNQAAALVLLAFNLFAWAFVNVAITRESRAGAGS